ncbi:MAG: YbaB/EbfC family nucleoid-associated protein [Kiritimatiellae bacterium]|nr:YbaB/EbfC family nucleoid-associated protein [Kiritimatiellia bacterium]
MGFFDQVKQAMQLRSETKKLQAEMEKITAEYSNGGITATARGDMSITSIKISPETWAEVSSGKTERFETMLFNVVNGALKSVKKATQEQMMDMMKNGGMNGLFGQ